MIPPQRKMAKGAKKHVSEVDASHSVYISKPREVARHIRLLFRAVDISHMLAHGVRLDGCTFMSEPDNANRVLRALSPDDNHPHAARPALLDTRSARVVRQVAKKRLPA